MEAGGAGLKAEFPGELVARFAPEFQADDRTHVIERGRDPVAEADTVGGDLNDVAEAVYLDAPRVHPGGALLGAATMRTGDSERSRETRDQSGSHGAGV